MNTDTTPSKDGSRLGSREVDAAVRELMLKHIIRLGRPRPKAETAGRKSHRRCGHAGVLAHPSGLRVLAQLSTRHRQLHGHVTVSRLRVCGCQRRSSHPQTGCDRTNGDTETRATGWRRRARGTARSIGCRRSARSPTRAPPARPRSWPRRAACRAAPLRRRWRGRRSGRRCRARSARPRRPIAVHQDRSGEADLRDRLRAARADLPVVVAPAAVGGRRGEAARITRAMSSPGARSIFL